MAGDRDMGVGTGPGPEGLCGALGSGRGRRCTVLLFFLLSAFLFYGCGGEPSVSQESAAQIYAAMQVAIEHAASVTVSGNAVYDGIDLGYHLDERFSSGQVVALYLQLGAGGGEVYVWDQGGKGYLRFDQKGMAALLPTLRRKFPAVATLAPALFLFSGGCVLAPASGGVDSPVGLLAQALFPSSFLPLSAPRGLSKGTVTRVGQVEAIPLTAVTAGKGFRVDVALHGGLPASYLTIGESNSVTMTFSSWDHAVVPAAPSGCSTLPGMTGILSSISGASGG